MTEDNVALYFLKALKQEGIEHIFLVPGSSIDPFVEHCPNNMTAVVAAHEGGAAFMADGYARARQGFGVCIGLGGPGVTNMVTAIAAAYADRSQVLVVSSTLPPAFDGDSPFQDANATGVDDLEIMRPITVWAQRVRAVYQKQDVNHPGLQPHPTYGKVGDFLQKAIRAMRGVENRPAFLSLPLEVLEESYEHDAYQPLSLQEQVRAIDTHAMKKVPEILASATRIAILAGNGCVWSQASQEIQEFAQEFDIPVVTTLRAKGLISEEHRLSFGFFGIGGTLQANKVVMGNPDDPKIPGAEVLLVLGATLNESNTYGWWNEKEENFPPSKALVRVDINPNNVSGKNYSETFVTGDIKTFLDWLQVHKSQYGEALRASQAERQTWLEAIRQTPYYDGKPEETQSSDQAPMHPARVVVELRKVAPRNTVLVVDSGAHSYYVPHYWKSYAPNEFLILTNTGPMGYGVALAIGAKMARPYQPCVAVVGDGSLLMHGMEIHTAVRYKVPLIIVVINNEALGNIYLRAINQGWSDEARALAEITPKLNCVDFARSLGADGILVQHPGELAAAFKQAFEFADSRALPFVVDVSCWKECKLPNMPDFSPAPPGRVANLSRQSRLFRYR
ncbi:MAG: thiamine pyrophosphate-binding protein [Aphanocapsa sp. GSE-SYN-MK-11-07L]|jgi:acetolactate synthase-1/2/3 large subunit|nr:thiamine pyrophosphate-binding protein [Aphanocapsa sp. GSE-SYN-MK-11-07L]